MKKIVLLLSIPLALASCGGGASVDGHTSGASGKSKPTEHVADPDAKAVTVKLTGGDDMKFNLTKINVKAGQKITQY